MVSPKSVHQRSFGRLGVLTMGGETLHATDGGHRPTQMDLRRMCARYIKRNAQTRRFWTRHSMVSCSRFPHFHFQKLHLTVTRTLSNDVKEFCFSTQLLYVTHRQSPIRADEENVVTESHIQPDTVLTKNDRIGALIQPTLNSHHSLSFYFMFFMFFHVFDFTFFRVLSES